MSSITLTAEEYFSKYQSLKEKLYLPLKIKLYFKILDTTLQTLSQNHSSTQNELSTGFYTVFAKFSNQ